MIRLLAIILLFQLPFQLVAQDSIFKSITATQVDNGMLISFTIRGGVTCSGVRIERSSDNNLFTEIHEIIGVCGAISTDESYSFTDENPIPNQESYYRLDMGTLGIYSEIVAVKLSIIKIVGL